MSDYTSYVPTGSSTPRAPGDTTEEWIKQEDKTQMPETKTKSPDT